MLKRLLKRAAVSFRDLNISVHDASTASLAQLHDHDAAPGPRAQTSASVVTAGRQRVEVEQKKLAIIMVRAELAARMSAARPYGARGGCPSWERVASRRVVLACVCHRCCNRWACLDAASPLCEWRWVGGSRSRQSQRAGGPSGPRPAARAPVSGAGPPALPNLGGQPRTACMRF
jgi:hypothetical protein